ncbi:MAG: hypothetical protein JJ992_15295, partial [Planctomycetes bacterium]|nr:hypothetical protein [Planctomycetota bacterium]
TTVQGGRAKLRIDALDKNAAVVNFMDVRGRVLTPGDETRALQLTQTGPGQYEGEFDARERGSYIVLVDYANGTKASPEFLAEDVSGDPAIYPDPETRDTLCTTTPYPAKVQRVVTRLWTQIKSGT